MLKNVRTGEMERLGSLIYVNGKSQTPCKDVLGPGAIVGVTKLKSTRTGDTLCEEKASFEVELPALPAQLISFALAPKQKGDEDKVPIELLYAAPITVPASQATIGVPVGQPISRP